MHEQFTRGQIVKTIEIQVRVLMMNRVHTGKIE